MVRELWGGRAPELGWAGPQGGPRRSPRHWLLTGAPTRRPAATLGPSRRKLLGVGVGHPACGSLVVVRASVV